MNAKRTLAIELSELTPVELDACILQYPKPLPYTSALDTAALDALAEALLEHESFGDALARIERYRLDKPESN